MLRFLTDFPPLILGCNVFVNEYAFWGGGSFIKVSLVITPCFSGVRESSNDITILQFDHVKRKKCLFRGDTLVSFFF
jgi:hypothetical protein